MRSRSAIRFIVALITSLGLVACGGTADDAQFSDRSVDESAVDQEQEDVGAMLRARLAQLEALPDRAGP